MKRETLKDYRCPRCRGGQLKVSSSGQDCGHDELVSAQLECESCAATYGVQKSIPRFVPASNYADSFGYQWNLHAKTQLDSYTGMPISRNRVFGVTGWPESMSGQKILEAGSGAGRFTEILAQTGATIFSFDFSSAIEANFSNNHARFPNLNLFQGDIFNVPFAPGGFDKVFCLGVIQHTPNPEAAFKSLVCQVRSGGELVIDVYARRFVSLLQWKYLLRPITKRMGKEALYKSISTVVPILLPVAGLLRKIAGKAGARLVPIVEYSHLGLPPDLNEQWAILDTFDMYSPAHDHPQSIATVKRWYDDAGFRDVEVGYGPNGVIAKGRKAQAAYMK